MQARQLKIPEVWEFTPSVYPDDRGAFANWYVATEFTKATGRTLPLAQTNHSVSRRGVVRGVHYALVPPGQAKYVYCPTGSMLDFIVDLRLGSPTFGQHDVVRLDTVAYRAVYVPEGLGHIVVALEDNSVACYLCSTGYDPQREVGVNPLDPELAIPFPDDLDLVLSDRDRSAPSLDEARAQGILPTYDDCLEWYAGPS